MDKKIAVVLLNLGGPDNLRAVRPFLFNLFNDRAIIGLPQPFRFLLAGLISWRRRKKAQGIYGRIGGRSPILEQTQAQAQALGKKLGENHRVFVCMRYWHPRAEEVVETIKEYDPDEIILLPLYPQYSTTTNGSSVEEFKRLASRRGLIKPQRAVCCYPTSGNFLRAHAALLREYIEKAKMEGRPRVLFSAHGLPKKIIDKGDPYQWQVEQTVAAIVNMMRIEALDWRICYQSKVGPLEWLGPNTEDEIVAAAKEGGIALVVVPVAFVSEHSETLVELDMDYRELAEKHGMNLYFRVPALGTSPFFIQALADACEAAEKADREKGCTFLGEKRCPQEFSCCPCVMAPSGL